MKTHGIQKQAKFDLTKKHVVDVLHELHLKQVFMTHAVSKMWGDTENSYGENIVSGSDLILNDIADQLLELVESLDRNEWKRKQA